MKRRVHRRPDRVAAIAIVGRIESQLRRKRETRLQSLDAAQRPAACQFLPQPARVAEERLAGSERQFPNGVTDKT